MKVIISLQGKASLVFKLFNIYCQQHPNKTLAEIAEGQMTELLSSQQLLHAIEVIQDFMEAEGLELWETKIHGDDYKAIRRVSLDRLRQAVRDGQKQNYVSVSEMRRKIEYLFIQMYPQTNFIEKLRDNPDWQSFWKGLEGK